MAIGTYGVAICSYGAAISYCGVAICPLGEAICPLGMAICPLGMATGTVETLTYAADLTTMLNQPGAALVAKIFMVTDTDNEKGSNAVKVKRPA